MKTFNILPKARWLVTIILLTSLSVGQMWGIDYTLTTTLTEGDYVIGAVKGTAGTDTHIYAFANTDNSSWGVGTETTPSDGKISDPASSIVWHLTPIGNNGFSLKNGTKYLTIGTGKGSGTVRYNSTSSGTIYFAATGSNSTYEISGVSSFTVASGNQVGYNIGSGYRQYAQRTHSTSTSSGQISVQFRFYKAAEAYTVTLKDDDSTLPEASPGAGVTLPSRTGCTGYTFVGWTASWTEEQDEWTQIAPVIIPAGSYSPTANVSLYPVYRKGTGAASATVTTTLTAGKQYVFGAVKAAPSTTLANNTAIGAIGFTTLYSSTSWGQYTTYTPNASGVITASIGAAYIWTLESISSGKYSFKNNNNASYPYIYLSTSTGSNQAGLNTSGQVYIEDVTATCKDAFKLHPGSSNTNKLLLNTGNSYGYRMYGSGQNESASMCPYIRFYEYNIDYYYISVPSCASCSADPSAGTASLNGSFSLTSVGVQATSASSGANCTYSDYGFLWSETISAAASLKLNESTGAAPSGATKVPVGNSGNVTSFTGALEKSSFEVGNTYYYRSYAHNNKDAGTYQYSSVESFTPRSVTFNLNGHGTSTPSTQYVNNGGKATDPSYSESVAGWTFGGWYDNEGCTGSAWNFTSNTVSGGNVTLYAKWTEKCATPTFSPAAGTLIGTQSVTISCASPSGTTIRYTTDGSTPTSSTGTVYSGAISVSATTTIKAIAYKSGCIDSDVATAAYTIKCETPTFSVAGGTKQGAQSVEISCATAGASIYYTTDGSTPTSSSTLYTGTALNITSTCTVKAIAIKAGLANSNVGTRNYTIQYQVTWTVNGDGDDITPTWVDWNTKPTFPTPAPSSCDATSTTFIGWTQTAWDGKIDQDDVDDLAGAAATKVYTDAGDMPNVTGNVTYHAVWAKATVVEGSATLDLTYDSIGSGYATSDITRKGITFKRTGDIGGFTCSSYKYIQIKANQALYNNTAFSGRIKSITTEFYPISRCGSGSDGTGVIYAGTSANPTTNNTDIKTTSDYITTVNYAANTNYTYFAVKATALLRLVSISITYANDDVGYDDYITTCCNTPTLAFAASPYAVLREDLGGASTTTWAEVDVTFTSNNTTGTISVPDYGSGKSVYKLSSWEGRGTTGGTLCTTDHAYFAVLTQPSGETPGTGKFHVKTTSGQTGQGTYRIAITQAATDESHGNFCETTVYGFVDVTLLDKFVDAVNGNGTVNKDGHGAQVATPALSEFGTQVENACHSEGRKLKGWIKETDLQTLYENGTPASTRVQTIDGLCESCDPASDQKSLVVAPGENITTSGATWYAVWAYER